MTEYIEPEDVDAWIGRVGLHYRERGLMLSALASPLPVFGREVYPGIHDKAAALLAGINRNHPLLDGNKRVSWMVTAAFYEINGWDLVVPQSQIDTFVRAVAGDKSLTHDEIAGWLEGHVRPL